MRPGGPGPAGGAARRGAAGRGRGARRPDRRRRAYDRRRRRRGGRGPRRTWCCCPGWSTRTCTSTSPAAPSGRASRTATRAAAAGGVTTIVDMPLNSIPPTTSTSAALRPSRRPRGAVPRGRRVLGRRGAGQRRRAAGAARGRRVRVQGFLLDSGVPEFPPLSAGRPAARRWRAVDGAVRAARRGPRRRARRGASARYADFLASRPPAAEERGDRDGARRWPRGAGAGCTSCTCPRRARCR